MTPEPRRGEVWWVAFDPALGGEVRKTRPAVVISNNVANAALNRVVVVPLSGQIQKLYPAETLVTIGETRSKAMADQITAASKLRLRERIGAVSPADVRSIERIILLHLGVRR